MDKDKKLTAEAVQEVAEEMLPAGYTFSFRASREYMIPTGELTLEHESTGRKVRYRARNTLGVSKSIQHFMALIAVFRNAPCLTATGVDERTDIDRILRWGLEDLELGFLYSVNQQGKAKRYPPLEWILEAAGRCPRTALHICGEQALATLRMGAIPVDPFKRIQVNGQVTPKMARDLCAKYPSHSLIFQYQGSGCDWLLEFDDLRQNMEILLDGSGGNGVLPSQWTRLTTHYNVGFAGGLNHTNMKEQVRQIQKVAKTGWWVDLESGLRDEEWFSVELLQHTHRAFARGLEQA